MKPAEKAIFTGLPKEVMALARNNQRPAESGQIETSDLMMPPIDVDDPTTWPPRVREIVSEWAENCKGTNYTNDLALPLDLERPFRELLTGHLLRALPLHEISSSRTGDGVERRFASSLR